MEFTKDELDYIGGVKRIYEDYVSDGWRCDFCEPDCTCDEDKIKELIDGVIAEFPRLSSHFHEIWLLV